MKDRDNIEDQMEQLNAFANTERFRNISMNNSTL